MRNIIIILIVFLINPVLFSQVNFELLFIISDSAQDDVLCNIWIDDLDDNGVDEMYALYTNHSDNNWKITCLDLDGNLEWNHISDHPNDFTSLINGLLFDINNSTYFAAVFSREVVLEPYTSEIYSDLKIYDWDNQTLVDSISIYIGTSGDTGGRYFSVNQITPIVLSNSLNLYIGKKITHSWGDWFEYHVSRTNEINRFSFINNVLTLEETISNAGSDLLHYSDNNFLISLCKNSWSHCDNMGNSSSGSSEYLKTLSFDIPSQVNEIRHTTNSNLQILTNNDLHYSYYGLSVYLSDFESDWFQCYAPDFADTLWISNQLGIVDEGCCLTSSTCISTNLGDNYIMSFGDAIEQPNPPMLEIRDRITGHSLMTQNSLIDPDFILRANDNLLYFIEGLGDPYNPAYYYVYKLENEIQLSSNSNVVSKPELELINYPNPFNPNTEIRFQVSGFSVIETAEITIYNLKGQKVRTFSNLPLAQSQNHQIVWDGTDQTNKLASSGVYLYKLNINGETLASRKCLLLK